MTARDGSAAGGSAPPPRASFLRRHPVLGAFGVLASLSLFASYFPLSAIVTGAFVAVCATGVDHIALRLAHRGVDAVVRRWRAWHPARDGSPPPSAPAPPAPSASGPGVASPHTRTAHLRTPEPRVSAHAEVRRRRRSHAREQHEASVQERELSGL